MRQSTTFTTRKVIEGRQLIARHEKPMVRGHALLAARDKLGGEATVVVRGADLCILHPDGKLASSGRTWEEAVHELNALPIAA